MWSAYKELYCTVDAAINKKQPDAIHDLDVALKKHKPAFLSLLTNPVSLYVYLCYGIVNILWAFNK
jgi:hypothetical protein